MIQQTPKQIFVVLLLTCLLVVSCGPGIPPPHPRESRLRCNIVSLRDLTGAYGPVQPKFEQLFVSKLKDDYTLHPEEGRTSYYDRTIILTNMFRPGEIIDQTRTPAEGLPSADLTVKGSVQQIQYGSPKEIGKYIVASYLFGIWGVASEKVAERETRAALVEYRFQIYRGASDFLIKTITIQGAHKSKSPHREQIILEANKIAAEELVFQLNESVAEILGKKPLKYEKQGLIYSVNNRMKDES